jgi:hypothetical protein
MKFIFKWTQQINIINNNYYILSWIILIIITLINSVIFQQPTEGMAASGTWTWQREMKTFHVPEIRLMNKHLLCLFLYVKFFKETIFFFNGHCGITPLPFFISSLHRAAVLIPPEAI